LKINPKNNLFFINQPNIRLYLSFLRHEARGIVAEPPSDANKCAKRTPCGAKVMERIARREHPKGAKRLAQRNFASQNSMKNEE
jgi:hypothetical protein